MDRETYLTFILGQELFAVNVSNVLEVLEQQHITRVPKTPEHIMGIINFRGEILPVINTRQKFNLISGEELQKYYIIIFEVVKQDHRFPVAAIADKVNDVIEINTSEIKPLPEMGLNYNVNFIAGTIRRDDSFIMILNIDKVFSLSDIEVTNQLLPEII